MKEIPLSDLRSILRYEPETGLLYWLKQTGTRTPEGCVAGHYRKENDYVIVGYEGERYSAHRIAWALYYGEWPQLPIDHINMDRKDNRISNLRLATVSENNINRPKQSNNTTGFKGVTFNKRTGKFAAKITFKKVTKCLGCFKTAEEAARAYQLAAKELHGEFAKF